MKDESYNNQILREMDSSIQNKSISELLLSLYNKGKIQREDMERIQNQLFDLLVEQSMQHGNKELKSEWIEQLMGSISYQILWSLSRQQNQLSMEQVLLTKNLQTLYEEGNKQMRDSLEECHKQFEKISKNCLDFELQAYQDTLSKGIPTFFDNYDLALKAQELPGEFDYPLFLSIDSTTGLFFVERYLLYLQCEEEFCHLFKSEAIESLLLGYSANYRRLCINIYELLFTNVLGNLLLGKSLEESLIISMNQDQVKKLQEMAKRCGHMELKQRVLKCIEPLVDWIQENQSEMCAWYVEESTDRFIQRFTQNVRNDTLTDFFVIPYHSKVGKNEERNHNRLNKEELSRLKAQLLQCDFAKDKISLLRVKTHHMEDLMELAPEVLFGEEIRDLFLQLNNEELATLMTQVLASTMGKEPCSWEDSVSWHLEFMLAIRMLDEVRQAEINHLVGKIYNNNL